MIRHKSFDPKMSLHVAIHERSPGSDGCRVKSHLISPGFMRYCRKATWDPYSGAHYSEQTECEEFTGRLQPAPFHPTYPTASPSWRPLRVCSLFISRQPARGIAARDTTTSPLPSLPHRLPHLPPEATRCGVFCWSA